MNPKGAEGRTLTCISCGSYRHLLTDCPHSWENMQANVAEIDNSDDIIIVATIIRFSGEEKFSGLQIISLFMPKGTKFCASNEKRLFENCLLIQK